MLFILFLTLFSFDVFGQGYGFWGTLGALLVHNIPSFVLLAVLLVAWKREIVGAIAFVIAGLLYLSLLVVSTVRSPPFHWYLLSWGLIIAGSAFIIGILFLISWSRKRKESVKKKPRATRRRS